MSHSVAPWSPSRSHRSSRVTVPVCHVTFGDEAGTSAVPRLVAGRSIPAPTVALVTSSMRMKLPVDRLRR